MLAAAKLAVAVLAAVLVAALVAAGLAAAAHAGRSAAVEVLVDPTGAEGLLNQNPALPKTPTLKSVRPRRRS